MAAMKECPSCGAEVPAAANRCKECFHDFTETKKRSFGLIGVLAGFTAMAILGAGTFWYVANTPINTSILVSEETHTIDFIKQYRSGAETESVAWDEIGKLEHIIRANGDFEIVAVKKSGERVLVEKSLDRPLISKAEYYSKLMEKPLEEIDNTTGFKNVRALGEE